jgi:GNAT superfamily N-acetyltransferase
VEIEIARFERSEEAEAVRLLTERFPPEEREAAYERRLARWRWQYYTNPNNLDSRPPVWVARAGRDLVGLVGGVPVRLRTPEGGVAAVWAMDLVVAPAMRGRGLGKRLMVEIADAAPVILGLGWTAAGLKADLAAGLKVFGGFRTGSLVISPVRVGIWALRQKHYKEIGRLLSAVIKAGRERRHVPAGANAVSDFPPGTAALWDRVARAYRFSVDRDTAYLDWRYGSHPRHVYKIVFIGPAASPAAIAVCRSAGGRPGLGIISDILVDPHDSQSLLDVVEAAVGFLRSQGAIAVSVDLPPVLAGHLARDFRYAAFRPLEMLVRSSDRRLEDLGIMDARAWYISLSDSDQDY